MPIVDNADAPDEMRRRDDGTAGDALIASVAERPNQAKGATRPPHSEAVNLAEASCVIA